MVRINFSVEGLSRNGLEPDAAREEILRTVVQHGFGEVRFDPALKAFRVQLDPALHSFADVRRTIGALGKRKGLMYLAVVMSP